MIERISGVVSRQLYISTLRVWLIVLAEIVRSRLIILVHISAHGEHIETFLAIGRPFHRSKQLAKDLTGPAILTRHEIGFCSIVLIIHITWLLQVRIFPAAAQNQENQEVECMDFVHLFQIWPAKLRISKDNTKKIPLFFGLARQKLSWKPANGTNISCKNRRF